jgi:hypothetical protein
MPSGRGYVAGFAPTSGETPTYATRGRNHNLLMALDIHGVHPSQPNHSEYRDRERLKAQALLRRRGSRRHRINCAPCDDYQPRSGKGAHRRPMTRMPPFHWRGTPEGASHIAGEGPKACPARGEHRMAGGARVAPT